MTPPGGAARDAPAGGEPRGRFIVSGVAEIMVAIQPALERDPTIRIVRISPAPPAPPQRIVAEMTPSRAAEIKAALGRGLLVEPDEPVIPAGG